MRLSAGYGGGSDALLQSFRTQQIQGDKSRLGWREMVYTLSFITIIIAMSIVIIQTKQNIQTIKNDELLDKSVLVSGSV